jgi:hypothetical protein
VAINCGDAKIVASVIQGLDKILGREVLVELFYGVEYD